MHSKYFIFFKKEVLLHFKTFTSFVSLLQFKSDGFLSMLLIAFYMGFYPYDFLLSLLLTLILLLFSMIILSRGHLWCLQCIVLLTEANEPWLISHHLHYSFSLHNKDLRILLLFNISQMKTRFSQ